MPRVTETSIERRRGRMLASLFLLVVAFATALVILSFADPNILTFLNVTPGAARLGFLALTLGLLALVWEKDREYRRLGERLHREQLLGAAFRSRLDVLEGLLRAGERLNAPLAVDEVLTVLLESALDLSGAVGGRATLVGAGGGDLEVSRTVHAHGWATDDLERVSLPLEVDGGSIATIELLFPKEAWTRESALEVLERFGAQAAGTLERATLLSRDRAALDSLRASQLVRSRFLAAVSHELRTPLTSIIGFAQTLDHHWNRLEETKKVQAVQAIEGESQRLWRVVERMLDAARVELEGVSIEPRFHDVRRTVDEALAPFLQDERSRVAVLLPKKALRAEVDPFVMSRTVSNLVDNALRYTEGDVQVVVHQEGEKIVIRVHDDGPGLTRAQLANATQPLFRVEENVKSGSGLGLHVVRTLVAEHHGTFDMSSDESGTTVVVTLPRRAERRSGARGKQPVRA